MLSCCGNTKVYFRTAKSLTKAVEVVGNFDEALV